MTPLALGLAALLAPLGGGQDYVPATVPDLPPVEWQADLAREAARQRALHPAPAHHAPARPPVVRHDADDPKPWDVSPPQRLDVAFPGYDGVDDEAAHAMCEHMGGTFTLEHDGHSYVVVCQGVDY